MRIGIDPLHFDAGLSEIGLAQVAAAAERVRDVPYELVVTSPLTRAIQTTVACSEITPPRRSSVLRDITANTCANSCDVGRSPALLFGDFPNLAFDHLDDVWWHDVGERDARGFVVEPEATLIARVAHFRTWLAARPERLIAVVGHGTFFYHLTGRHLDNCEIAILTL